MSEMTNFDGPLHAIISFISLDSKVLVFENN